jgi:uncharacterized protein (TIGR02147 family)
VERTVATPSTDFRSVLRQELVQRTKSNPRYTLRTFAKYLELSPATLSSVLNGKRKLSIKRARRIAQQLDLSPREEKTFVGLVEESHDPVAKPANEDSALKNISQEELQRMQLDDDVYQAISDWYHAAILEMTEIKNIKVTARTASNRLKCTYIEAADAIERLKRLGLLTDEDGRLKKVNKSFGTKTDIPSSALRRRHMQVLQKAKHALVMEPLLQRDFTSVTMAIDSSKLPEAKRRIAAFRRELSDFLEDGKRDKVYELSVQLFSLM